MSAKVLAVDDNPVNLQILTHLLGSLCEMKVSSHGEDALKKISEFKPDLVLLDIMMPGMDGYEVCRRIREMEGGQSLIKVILISAKGMLDERLKGYEVGADDYLVKPFDHEELLAKIRVFLKLKKTEDELRSLNVTLEKAVLQASKLASIGEMAAEVAHEINNPLTIIQGNLEILKDRLEQKAESDCLKLVDKQQNALNRMVNIVKGLKTYSRTDTSELNSINLHEVIDQSVTILNEVFKNETVKINRRLQCTAPFVLGNVGKFQQVLINFVTNARDALEGKRGGIIEISTQTVGSSVEVRVSDNGCGIPQEVISKIFEPFFTSKPTGKGTGLGLSIVMSILHEMKGKVKVESEVGVGTTFTLTFPLAAKAEVI